MALRLVWLMLAAGLCTLASLPITAQTQPQGVEALKSIEDPAARVAAIEEFLKTNSDSRDADAAREEMARSLELLAEAQLATNNIDEAMKLFRQALASWPQKLNDRFFDEVVMRIPLALSVRGYRTESILLAREIDPRCREQATMLGAVGEFYLSVEDAGDAIRVLEAATKLARTEAAPHRALGSAYRMGLRLDAAAQQYRLAIELDRRDKQAYGELANLARAEGDYPEAEKLYKRQLEIDRTQTAPRKGLALAYTAEGKDQEAQAALDEVRRLKGADEITRDLYLQTQLALVYLERNKIKEAEQAAAAAVTIEPRYSWARIAAAEIDLAAGRYFEAENHLLAALRFGSFPTLYFTLGKVYLSVEDFDGALEQFATAFSVTAGGKLKARLGGQVEAEGDGFEALLARERRAGVFVALPSTSEEDYQLAESLIHFDAAVRGVMTADNPRPSRRPRTPASASSPVERTAINFIEASGARRPFRALYVSQRLTQAGRELQFAARIAGEQIPVAEASVEADGSLKDFPNFDREGRTRIFLGRLQDARGWALFKEGHNNEAIASLTAAVKAYGDLPEGRRAMWHLATARETAGELEIALNLYITAYEPPSRTNPSSDVNRAVIESLYRKVHGSLDGLEARIGPAPAPIVATAPKRPPVESKPASEPKASEIAPTTPATTATASAVDLPFTASNRHLSLSPAETAVVPAEISTEEAPLPAPPGGPASGSRPRRAGTNDGPSESGRKRRVTGIPRPF
jgi:tetratricopeptide (TPR) repeat protein